MSARARARMSADLRRAVDELADALLLREALRRGRFDDSYRPQWLDSAAYEPALVAVWRRTLRRARRSGAA